MRLSPWSRGLAAFLVAQPFLWTSSITYAQSLQDAPGAGVGAIVSGTRTLGELEPGQRFIGAQSSGEPSAPPVDETVDPTRYVCGPGDVLELNFWGVQNFKVRVTIDLEGRAFIPKIGYFALQGRTLATARELMRESVARYYRLRFDLALAVPRTFLVQVVDDVARPDTYPARAIERVASVIAKAGGFGQNASQRKVEIRRRDGSVLIADLVRYRLTGDLKYNPYLLDGDVVRVPFEEVAATIIGAVNRPGRYELVASRDLEELLDLAGGLSPAATRLLPISVIRRGPNDRVDLRTFNFVGGKPPAIAVERGDELRIPAAGELQQEITVIGAFAGASPIEGPVAQSAERGAVTSARGTAPEESTSTRRLAYVRGDSVRSVLDRVGGVGPLADLSGSYILREGRTIRVDLYRLVMLRDLDADKPLDLGDTLVIPFMRRNVVVEGSVFAPGAYPYNPAFGVEQYVSLAGGLSRNARPIDEVKVITPTGETKVYRHDLQIDPGSSVVVPERGFSRTEVVQIVLSAAGIILSGVAVIIAARK